MRRLASFARTCALVCACALGAGCSDTTGSALITFAATAAGPPDATGGPLVFASNAGSQITLERARLHVGAVYLNQTVPLSGASAEPCIAPGTYVGEVFGPLDVDLLSATPQPFPTTGEGTQTEAHTAEVWLTGGDVNALADPTVILDVAGTAVQAGASYPFAAAITIGQNRAPRVTNPAMPGASPICHQRIVSPILIDLTPTQGGTLALQIDPRAMFRAVDFSTLTPASTAPPFYQIPDTSDGAGAALYRGFFASAGVYRFSYTPEGGTP
jgi:hypothetical protein